MAPSTLADKRRRLVADPKASRSCPSLRCDGPAHRASGASGRRTPAQGRKKPGSAHFRSLTGLDFGGVDASLRFWIGGREREVRIFSADPRYPKLVDLAGHRIAVRSHDAIHRAPLFLRRPARPIASRHAKSRASRRLRATSCGSGPVGIALRSSSRIASSTRSGTSPITASASRILLFAWGTYPSATPAALRSDRASGAGTQSSGSRAPRLFLKSLLRF